MTLITQPDAGVGPLITAVRRARRTIDIVIFRFDLDLLEEELGAAVARGVVVRALIAHTNRGGEQRLRKLELRLFKAGVTVCRTKDDLVRYHGKLMAIDRRRVLILGFNDTAADLKSRSFGVEVRSRRIVNEVLRLFESDANRTDFVPRVRDLVGPRVLHIHAGFVVAMDEDHGFRLAPGLTQPVFSMTAAGRVRTG